MSTLEVEPLVATALFGARIELARRFTRDLADRGEELGLIGPLELPRLWSRHILNSALLAPLMVRGGVVGDVGSGAGLPGLVLAVACPDTHFVLIEPMERRVDWLIAESGALGLTNVEVIRARAEDVALRPLLDQVTARAVSALSKLLPLVVPLVRSGGEVILLKGAAVDREVVAAERVIRRLRLSNASVALLGDERGTDVTRVFRATVA